MTDIENFENSLEFQIGTRFYFRNTLYEVAEMKDRIWGCSKCQCAREGDICELMNCNYYRHDKKRTFIKKVEQSKEENNDGQ